MKGPWLWYALIMALGLYWLFPKEASGWTLLLVASFILFIGSIDNFLTRRPLT